MDRTWFLLYNIFVVPFLFVGFRLAGLFNSKVKDGLQGRKNQHGKIVDAISVLERERKKILFHCVSVGEWEQAIPIIELLKRNDPQIFVVVSFFSPSGYNYVKSHPQVDLKVYLPFDSYAGAKKFLKSVAPDLWIISKHDVWPNHLFAAGDLDIPTILIDASMPSDSKRIRGIVKYFNKSVYKNFSMMFPISEEDRDRLLTIFPYPERVVITGDTRFDQVYRRGEKARSSGLKQLFQDSSSLKFIAGSIWPSDEKHLLPALIKLLKQNEKLKAILVPHEPQESHISEIEQILQSSSLKCEKYTAMGSNGNSDTRVVIIDTIGMLASLYAQADVAYVGGSFGPGVHNVMEPAVLGLPVLFGPKHLNSFEASELIRVGGGYVVGNVDEIEGRLNQFITSAEERKKAGQEASKLILNNLGSSERIYNNLSEKYGFISINNTN